MSSRDDAKRLRDATATVLPQFLVLNIDANTGESVTWHRTGKELDDLEWRARYAPQTLTREDIMAFAGIASSYRALIYKPSAQRDAVCARMRQYDDSEGDDSGTWTANDPSVSTAKYPACLGYKTPRMALNELGFRIFEACDGAVRLEDPSTGHVSWHKPAWLDSPEAAAYLRGLESEVAMRSENARVAANSAIRDADRIALRLEEIRRVIKGLTHEPEPASPTIRARCTSR